MIGFLRKLSDNNDREWFQAHKAEYKEAEGEFNAFVEKLIDGIAYFDSSVRGLTVRDCTYRIYRDTRFSNNKLPYKNHMGAYVCRGGKKSGYAGYYFHVQPVSEGLLGGHLLSTGLYMPEPVVLRSVREDIAYNGEQFVAAIKKAKGFRLGQDNVLKRVPLGFPADSPYAEYLKMKDIYLEQQVDDSFMLSGDLLRNTVEAFHHTFEFSERLNRAIKYAYEEMK